MTFEQVIEWANKFDSIVISRDYLNDLTRRAIIGDVAREKIGSLFAAIEHGDDEHRAWLKEKINKHFGEGK